MVYYRVVADEYKTKTRGNLMVDWLLQILEPSWKTGGGLSLVHAEYGAADDVICGGLVDVERGEHENVTAMQGGFGKCERGLAVLF